MNFTRYILFFSLCSLWLSSSAQSSARGWFTGKAIRSSIAANAVGVNTHLNYLGSVYDLHYSDIIKPRLAELGVRHIRDHFGNQIVNNRYVELAHQYGIKLLIICADNGEGLAKARDEVVRLNQIDPEKPVVELIEPANERDNGWKNDWEKLCGYLGRYYDVFKNSTGTHKIPLLGPSFANTRNSAVDFAAVCKSASVHMDAGNLHAYSGLFPESPMAGGWGISFEEAKIRYQKLSLDKPVIETESGYKMSEGADGHPAISERVAAKYAPRLVLSRLKAGVSPVYFYQLINNSEDFGLLNKDGSPRLQYTALKNFIHLMQDSGDDFKPGTLEYSIGGDLKDIHHQLFQKNDGRFMLVIWHGVNGSTGGTSNNDYHELNNPEWSFRIALKNKAKRINIYRPSFDSLPDGNGIKPVRTYQGVSSFQVNIPDHIVCIEIF